MTLLPTSLHSRFLKRHACYRVSRETRLLADEQIPLERYVAEILFPTLPVLAETAARSRIGNKRVTPPGRRSIPRENLSELFGPIYFALPASPPPS